MPRLPLLSSLLLATSLFFVTFSAQSSPLTLTVTPAKKPAPADFKMGTAAAPDGTTLTVTSQALLLNGEPWTPVMGEFHYARYPASEWRTELLKMKAGGIDIVATYVFWIHHEETEGQWNWSGDHDLRRFLETVREVGLKAIVRCGPWCHGEVRNGGLPDWIVQRGSVRSDDPAYLASAKLLYKQIAQQVSGLLWKEGGPVVGIQIENEYGGPAQHLLTLKKIAIESGLDVPLYTRTGWPALKTPMPFGELIPLYGVYAEGFWDRELTSMPGNYWAGFHFSTLRTDSNIANEALGRRDTRDADDIARYPYLTCEIGGGMMSSYHRRILVDPRDISSTTLVKLGSGSNSPGYYMYHGGTNPEGRLTTLMEEQATAITNWNDMPVKNYDFQAPLGQYGQVRPHYHTLRRLHLFLNDFGARLAAMPTYLPEARPAGKDDLDTLRWSARSDGRSGFIFINNYERGRALPEKRDVQFQLKLAETGPVTFPSTPVTIPSAAHAIWPFNLDLGGGVKLAWATAQPVATIIGDGNTRTIFFAETPGVAAEFVFTNTRVIAHTGRTEARGDRFTRVLDVPPGRDVALTANSSVRIVLLSEADSLALWKTRWQGRTRAFLTTAALTIDGTQLRLTSADPSALNVGVMPGLRGETDGVFQRLTTTTPAAKGTDVAMEELHVAGALRTIALGKSQKPVAAAPVDADFAQAARWKIKLPADLDLSTDPLLRLHYTGDVARVFIGGKFITDDYYNGNALEIGLSRHADALKAGEIEIAILPLQKDAPIFLPESAKPDFGKDSAIAKLTRVELVPRYTVELTR